MREEGDFRARQCAHRVGREANHQRNAVMLLIDLVEHAAEVLTLCGSCHFLGAAD